MLYKPWRRRIDKKRVGNAHFEPLSQEQSDFGPEEEVDGNVSSPNVTSAKDVSVYVEPVGATDSAGPANR